jgi:hypothetical protein
MKFIFFTDSHFSSRAPSRRKDKWPDVCYSKLKWIVDIANEYKVDYILSGGDWFKGLSPEPPYWIANGTRNILLEGPPTLTILGQHDVYGHKPASYVRGVIHTLESSCFNVLQEGITILPDKTSIRVINHSDNILESLKINGEDTATITIIHGMVVPQSVPWPHILCKDVHISSEVFLCGDYHPGFVSHPFYNPGSLMRLSIEAKPRQPNVIFLQTEDGHMKDLRIISVEVAELYENVFDEQSYIENKNEEKQQENLVSLMNSLVELPDIDNINNIDMMIDSIGNNLNCPPKSIILAKELCSVGK